MKININLGDLKRQYFLNNTCNVVFMEDGADPKNPNTKSLKLDINQFI